MTAKFPIDAADKEAFVNVGLIGLMDALDKYDVNRNVQFETYAKFRIRGAVLDELRAGDWVPRSVRSRDHKLEEAFFTLQKELGRPPAEEELADHLDLDLEGYFKLLDDSKGQNIVSTEDLPPGLLENLVPDDVLKTIDQQNPFELLAGDELRNLLKKSIDDLPEKERLVMALYYYEELTMKEIGKVLDLTESRICQLHSQSVLRLRAALRELR